MPTRLRRHLSFANVTSLLALFVALSAGAYAANTIRSSDIVDGEVKRPDIANNAVSSPKIVDGEVKRSDIGNNAVDSPKIASNAATGDDVAESTLGKVPSAQLADGAVLSGFAFDSDKLDGLTSSDFLRSNLITGRDGFGATSSCDPNTSTFASCAFVTVTLPAPARVLVSGRITAIFGDGGHGTCQLWTQAAPIPGTDASTTASHVDQKNLSLMGDAGVFPAGQHSFGIQCNQGASFGSVSYVDGQVIALAVPPN